jgi:uncharacterized membrane protein
MSAFVWTDSTVELRSVADKALRFAARFWFVVAAAGQWFFAAYVIAFYGGAAVRRNLAAWNEVVPNGYAPGLGLSNAVVGMHLLLAVVIMAGGPLQFIPWIRTHAPAFHRWNGRLYLPAVVLTSIAGLFMVWSRERADRVVQYTGVSVHAVLVVCFALLAVRHVLAGDFRSHRRWALRMFMLINAAWFFRIGLLHRVFIDQDPSAFDPMAFTPLTNLLSVADYLLPIALLELYLRTRDRPGHGGTLAVAATLMVMTVVMGLGLFAAARVLWLPRM